MTATWRLAKPSRIAAALEVSQQQNSGGWFVAGQSSDVGRKESVARTIAGREIVLWRNAEGGLVAGPGGYRRFDSLAVDAEGNICVATLVEGAIMVFSPGGELLRSVPMPERWPTNICFGGPDLRTAYITLSSTGRLVRVPWDRPGLPLHHSHDVAPRGVA